MWKSLQFTWIHSLENAPATRDSVDEYNTDQNSTSRQKRMSMFPASQLPNGQPQTQTPKPLKVEDSPTNIGFSAEAQLNTGSGRNAPKIRFRKRETTKNGTIESDWHDQRKHDDGKTPPYWLAVMKIVEDGDKTTHDLTILDMKLRDRIRTVLSAYINHTDMYAWHLDAVTVKTLSATIILNFDKLRAEAQRGREDETSRRLQEFLDLFRALANPQFFPNLSSDLKNVRLEYECIWTIYYPGKLVVSNKHGADYPQVFRVDKSTYTEDGQLIISAWMWDWNGDYLTRSIYDFRIQSYRDGKSPSELDCYPVEFYEAKDGSRGIDALQAHPASKDRRNLFLKYTFLQKTTVKVLRYSGDAFGDATVFPQDYPEGLFTRSRKESRVESKLVKVLIP